MIKRMIVLELAARTYINGDIGDAMPKFKQAKDVVVNPK